MKTARYFRVVEPDLRAFVEYKTIQTAFKDIDEGTIVLKVMTEPKVKEEVAPQA